MRINIFQVIGIALSIAYISVIWQQVLPYYGMVARVLQEVNNSI
jgi:hypothetical protein